MNLSDKSKTEFSLFLKLEMIQIKEFAAIFGARQIIDLFSD